MSEFSQADVDRIVKARLDEERAKHAQQVTVLRDEAKRMADQLKEVQPLAARAQELERDLAEIRESTVRDGAFRAAGLDSEEHAPVRERLTQWHRAIAPTAEGGEPLAFVDWLSGPAKEDPVLGHVFAKATPKPPAAAGAAPESRQTAGAAGGSPAGAPRTTPSVSGRPPEPSRPPDVGALRAQHKAALDRLRSTSNPQEREAIRAEAAGLLREVGIATGAIKT